MEPTPKRGVQHATDRMYLELFSTAMLAAFIWVLTFLLPRATKARDGMALTTALLSAILAALAWLFLSAGIRSR